MFHAVLSQPSQHGGVSNSSSTWALHALLSTGGVVVDLVAPLATLLRPREVSDGDEEERVAWIGDTGERVVPGAVLVRP